MWLPLGKSTKWLSYKSLHIFLKIYVAASKKTDQMVLRISYKSLHIFFKIYTRIFFIRCTKFFYTQLIYSAYIVYRTSYIRRYADTFIVISFFKDNQFLLFIVLICRTCKCFVLALYL